MQYMCKSVQSSSINTIYTKAKMVGKRSAFTDQIRSYIRNRCCWYTGERDIKWNKAAIVREYLKQEKVVELPHPPYSPDLATCDFFLFPRLKKHLAGRKYQTRKNLGSAIFQCLNSIPRKDIKTHLKIGLKDWIFVYHMVASILKD